MFGFRRVDALVGNMYWGESDDRFDDKDLCTVWDRRVKGRQFLQVFNEIDEQIDGKACLVQDLSLIFEYVFFLSSLIVLISSSDSKGDICGWSCLVSVVNFEQSLLFSSEWFGIDLGSSVDSGNSFNSSSDTSNVMILIADT